jgi:hypothetical protein
MIQQTELALQRSLTARFIEADPLEIQLLRESRVSNGSGGYDTAEDPAPVGGLQRMRLIPLGDGATERLTADGKAVTPNYMLLGSWDSNMQRWDLFELNGIRYQIVFINQNTQYQKKGEVAYLGG